MFEGQITLSFWQSLFWSIEHLLLDSPILFVSECVLLLSTSDREVDCKRCRITPSLAVYLEQFWMVIWGQLCNIVAIENLREVQWHLTWMRSWIWMLIPWLIHVDRYGCQYPFLLTRCLPLPITVSMSLLLALLHYQMGFDFNLQVQIENLIGYAMSCLLVTRLSYLTCFMRVSN